MPGEELPDPPIPDVPKYSPIFPRTTRRITPPPSGYVPGGPVTASPHTIATGLAEGDLVEVLPGSHAKHTGATGTIHRFRPPLSTGIRPVSIRLTENCPCGCAVPTGMDILVSDDRLVRATAPAKATLPSLRRGDRVLITRFARPTYGTVITAETDPVRYYVAVDDGSEEWFSPRDLKPAPTAILDEPTWAGAPEPEPPPPPPGVSTEYPPRYLFVAIPLTQDPDEDPTDATELIDLIAERHDKIHFEARDLEEPC